MGRTEAFETEEGPGFAEGGEGGLDFVGDCYGDVGSPVEDTVWDCGGSGAGTAGGGGGGEVGEGLEGGVGVGVGVVGGELLVCGG